MVSKEQLAAYVAQYGRAKLVVYNGHHIVFRRPSKAECRQHQADNAVEGSVAQDCDERLALLLVVHCDDVTREGDGTRVREALGALFEEYGYMIAEKSVSGALKELTGVIQSAAAKSDGSTSSGSGTPLTNSQVA